MKKTIWVLIFFILLWILLFPYEKKTYKDWWTKTYSALLYKYIRWSRLVDCDNCIKPYYKEDEIVLFPNNFKNLDAYWKEEYFKKIPKYENNKKEKNILKNLKSFSYSNLTEEKTKDFIKNTLKKYDISQKNIDNYFYYVDYFNDAVEKEGLTKDKFKEMKNFSRDGDYPLYLEKLEKKNIDFMGTNCRITSFTLFKDLVNVENLTDKASLVLNFDNSSIENFPKKIFDETDTKKFLTFFAGIPTPLVKDKQVHLKNIKKYFEEHNIKFNTKPWFSVISMINHDDLDNILFIGHIGILLEAEGKFVFLEKLSFDLPYQAVVFDKKSEVYDYFMKKYGDMISENTAKPFLMENDKEFKVKK